MDVTVSIWLLREKKNNVDIYKTSGIMGWVFHKNVSSKDGQWHKQQHSFAAFTIRYRNP